MVKNCGNCEEEVVEMGDEMEELMNLLEDAEEECYNKREIFVNGEIDNTTFRKYIAPIIQINKEDDEVNIPVEEREPIKLYFNCIGGDVTQGLALCDIIEASKTPIIGINMVYSMSMGAIILLCCHKRYSYKRATVLIHDGGMNISNSGSKARDTFNFVNTLEDYVKEIIINRSKISKKMLTKNWSSEWYISSNKALELGIIDEIIDTII